MTSPIGYIGNLLNLQIRQGCDFETIEVTYLEGTDPVDLTGCTLLGAIADQYGVKKADMALTVTDAATGKFTINITHTESAKLIALDKSSTMSPYQWQAELTDASGNVKPLFYGNVIVQRDLVP